MKKIVAVIMTAFVVTSCTVEVKSSTPAAPPASSVASSSAPAPTPTEETKEPSPDPTPAVKKTKDPVNTPEVREAVFPTYIHDKIPPTQVLSDAQVVKFGKQVCTALDSAGVETKLEFAVFLQGYMKGTKGALTSSQAAQFAGASIAAFCPAYGRFLK